MREILASWSWLVKSLCYLVVGTVVCGGLLSLVVTRAAEPEERPRPAWAAPAVKAIRRVGPPPDVPSAPHSRENLDCATLTYRLIRGSTRLSGCFIETSFGFMDISDDRVIMNGTDEAVPLLPYGPNDSPVPWPRTSNLLAFKPVITGGSSVGLYKNLPGALEDQRDHLGRLTAKRIKRPADVFLEKPGGGQLVINAPTIAFSEGGTWLVAETLSGSFVRINLATLHMTFFAPAFGSSSGHTLHMSRIGVSDDGRYVAIANDQAPSFKVYDLTSCGAPLPVHVDLPPQNCPVYDYQSFAEQQIGGPLKVRHVRFVSDGLLSFEILSSDPAKAGVYQLAPAASITSLTEYIGLGDSYASGEGAFNYLVGTDTGANGCHLSRHSYPLLLTSDLYGSAGGHSVACSGAKIKDIASTRDDYRGQVRGGDSLEQLRAARPDFLEVVEAGFTPGYIAQHRFVKRWQPQVVTVGIGGNDIGFDDLIKTCVVPRVSLLTGQLPRVNTCFNTHEDRVELQQLIDRTIPRWTALYQQLRREAPGARLYAIGYPQVADDTGRCAPNVQLSTSELEFAAHLIDYLNEAMHTAAQAAGVPYVDISQALRGHRLCETAGHLVAVNGITAGNDGGLLGLKLFGKESFHPNALGHQLIKQAILQQTNNLTAYPPPAAPSSRAATNLLNAPASGRTIHTRIPVSGLAPDVIKRGEAVTISVSGPETGLKPQTTYTIRLNGPAGPVLGTTISGSTGDIEATITLPEATPPGGHTIDVTGPGQTDEPLDVTQPIYVPHSDDDSDGDGIPSPLDTCPGAINSGQDTDLDGIDDVCDSLIGPPPSNPPSPPPAPAPTDDTEAQGQAQASGNSNTGVPGQPTPQPPGPLPAAPVPPPGNEPPAAAFDPEPLIPVASVTPAALTTVARFPVSPPASSSSHATARLVNSRVLSTAILNTRALRPVAAQPPGPLSSSSAGVLSARRQVLRIIHWLPWALLIIGGTALLFTAERYTKRRAYQLQ